MPDHADVKPFESLPGDEGDDGDQQCHLDDLRELERIAGQIGFLKQLTPRAAAGLDEFTRIVESLRDDSQRLTPAELVPVLAERSGLLGMVRSQCKDEAGFLRRKANLDELASWFEGARGGGPGELAAQLALLSNADRGEPGNAVRLMSLHAAKGLEFRTVFVIGCEDGNLPHEASVEEGGLEEERRLMYVGITRAQRSLNITWCERRKSGKEFRTCEPSRFIAEMGGDIRMNDRKTAQPVSKEEGKARLANLMAMFENRDKA